ncbi:hypothetical protein C8R47DRAFT_1228745 [Mycena vitilis]|nr:hypothetical protein C8R47DRAFT_1228745 [Mycena vitilis]
MGICGHSASFIALAVGPARHAVALNIFFSHSPTPSAVSGRLGTLFARRLFDINRHQRRPTSVDQASFELLYGHKLRDLLAKPSGLTLAHVVSTPFRSKVSLDFGRTISSQRALISTYLHRSDASQSRKVVNDSFGATFVLSVQSPLVNVVEFNGTDRRVLGYRIRMPPPSLVNEAGYRTQDDLPLPLDAETIFKLDYACLDRQGLYLDNPTYVLAYPYTSKFNHGDMCVREFNLVNPGYRQNATSTPTATRLALSLDWDGNWDGGSLTDDFSLVHYGLKRREYVCFARLYACPSTFASTNPELLLTTTSYTQSYSTGQALTSHSVGANSPRLVPSNGVWAEDSFASQIQCNHTFGSTNLAAQVLGRSDLFPAGLAPTST